MFPRVLSLFNDLYDAATAAAMARAVSTEGTLRHGLLEAALRSLCAADELLAERQRDLAMDQLLRAIVLLKDAIVAGTELTIGTPDPAAVAIDLACRACEALDLLGDAAR